MANDPVPMPAQGVASPSYARQTADSKRIAAVAPRPAEQTQTGPKDAKREIVETVANVALNILTNYVNHVARTVVDFAEVKPGQPGGDSR